jgi:hypothetical protein
MKYSDAFDRLYALSLEIPMKTEQKYKRIGIFISNVLLIDYFSHWPWDQQNSYIGKKDIMIEHICDLTDFEWDAIKEHMIGVLGMEIVAGMGVVAGESKDLREKRIGWIHDLDTLRAFNP